MNPERGQASAETVELEIDGTTPEAQLVLALIYRHADAKKRSEVRASIRRELERDSVHRLRDRSVEHFIK